MQKIAAIGLAKLSIYLQRNLREDELKKIEYLIPTDFPLEIVHIREEEAWSEFIDTQKADIKDTLHSWEDNIVSKTMVELLFLKSYLPQYSRLIELVIPGNGKGIMFETAMLICFEEGISQETADLLRKAYDMLELFFLAKHNSPAIENEILCCDERMTAYFAGSQMMDWELADDCQYIACKDICDKIYGYDRELSGFMEEASSLYQEDKELCVVVRGEAASGRLACIRKIAKKIKSDLIIVPFDAFTNANHSMHFLRKIIRECLLKKALLCISQLTKEQDIKDIKRLVEHDGRYRKNLLFLHVSKDMKLLPYLEKRVIEYQIPTPNRKMSMSFWEGFLKEYELDKQVDAAEISSLITMEAGQIKKAVQMIAMKSRTRKERITNREIFKICYQILDDGRYENVHRVEPGYHLEDLKLNDKNMEVLKDIINQVIYRRKVYDEWGMSEKYAYGRCVSVLLAGPPGTGKTMAVHGLAAELGLDLYKVDLSQVQDKYIGETEKRLEEIFKKAEKCNMILFFDEADAVMGKRTDTTDARDKNANAQIAYILQRIEEFDGIVVLATNLLRNIDNAFLRRIRYVLQFDYPEKENRLQIWKNAFEGKVPLSEDIDFDYLADTFQFTGAIIKNIVLNATFIAASMDSEVRMEYIMRAINREATKDRNLIAGIDLGKYEYLMG